MSDRHGIVRRIYAEEATIFDVATRGFRSEGENSLGLRVLRKTHFPELTVEVLELFDAPDDRVVARLEVHLGTDLPTYEAIQIWRFRGNEVAGVWSMHDPLPWIEAAGVADEVIRRRRSPPG